jgi:hypothetical protein
MSALLMSRARSTIKRHLRRASAVVTVAAITAFAVASCAREGGNDAKPAPAAAPRASAWGDTHVPYRAVSGRFCEVAAEGTSIRPDVVNRLLFLEPRDTQRLITELRARDRELVTEAPAELASDLDAIAQAADRLYDALEASGFNLYGVPEEAKASLSAVDLRPAFERSATYLLERCDIDISAILSTV